jgi:hypothetical protein
VYAAGPEISHGEKEEVRWATDVELAPPEWL